MEIIQIVGLGLIAAVISLILKEQQPLFSFLLVLITGAFILMFLVGKISSVIQMLEELVQKSNVNPVFWKTILKIIGIAYIAEFGAQIVRDAGQESIALKIELAGKILIMILAIPIISALIQTVLTLLPSS